MEETRSVLGAICASYSAFFKAERKLADYIIGNKESVVGMTVGELARASSTSEASVSRFCRRCGFSGFHSLKLALAAEVAGEKKGDGRVSNEISRAKLDQSLKNILANKVAELTETVSRIDTGELEEILTRLERARLVQFAAAGNTIPVAMEGAFKLNQLGIMAMAPQSWEAQAAAAFNLGPEDVMIVISSSGMSAHLEEIAGGAKKNGCLLVAVTNSARSPLAKLGDYRIITATREKLLAGEFWYSKLAAMAVIEMIYLLLQADMEQSAEHMRRLEQVIAPDKRLERDGDLR